MNEGKSLSDLLKSKTLDSLENAYDTHVGEIAYKEYLNDPVSRSLGEWMKERGIEK